MNTTDKDKQNKGFKALTLDMDTYQALLDDPALSEDQKHEFLETLWTVIVQLVDWGYGIHPVQQTQQTSKSRIALSPIVALIEEAAGNTELKTHNKELLQEGANL